MNNQTGCIVCVFTCFKHRRKGSVKPCWCLKSNIAFLKLTIQFWLNNLYTFLKNIKNKITSTISSDLSPRSEINK